MLRALILTCCVMAAPACAEDAVLTIAQDRYAAGASVRFEGPAVTDLFMAGNRVVVAAPVAGSAHLAGRRVAVEAAVSGNLFAAGSSVVVGAAVGEDASITGYEVSIGPVAGNLRAAGAEVTLGDVGSYALISSANVIINGAVTGDMVLVVDRIEFGAGATVAGALTIYAADMAKVVVPESVAPAARLKIETRESYDNDEWAGRMPV